ncbi:MAG: polysaccharide deacetylase family protein [Clostridia bacterium]|nr:polysaccharide deacetylase family protein [Clostridia bacterium]
MNRALLTIDDLSSRNTPALVDYLNEKGITAIFFAVGQNVERYYKEALYALQNGMIVGNHSYSHPAFSSISLEEGIQEIEKCEAVLNRLYQDSGTERRYRPFRFPYGDKGGPHKDALQQYLREQHFSKVNDTFIPYSWWQEYSMDTDIDTFWSFDFEEYKLSLDPAFTRDSIWNKMHETIPKSGSSLFGENNRHILLMHDFDETEALFPRYYQHIIDHALENGLQFDAPSFL